MNKNQKVKDPALDYKKAVYAKLVRVILDTGLDVLNEHSLHISDPMALLKTVASRIEAEADDFIEKKKESETN